MTPTSEFKFNSFFHFLIKHSRLASGETPECSPSDCADSCLMSHSPSLSVVISFLLAQHTFYCYCDHTTILSGYTHILHSRLSPIFSRHWLRVQYWRVCGRSLPQRSRLSWRDQQLHLRMLPGLRWQELRGGHWRLCLGSLSARGPVHWRGQQQNVPSWSWTDVKCMNVASLMCTSHSWWWKNGMLIWKRRLCYLRNCVWNVVKNRPSSILRKTFGAW